LEENSVKRTIVSFITAFLAEYNQNDQVEGDEMGRACPTRGREKDCIQASVGKHKESVKLERPKCRWYNNFNFNSFLFMC
jgi:hypothetical protein